MSLAVVLSQRAKALLDQPPCRSDPVDDSPVTPGVQAAVEAALDRGETHYTDRPGILPLREATAALLADRFGIKIDAAADLVMTCGATEARFIAIQQLLKAGDHLAAPDATSLLSGAALLRGARVADAITSDAKAVYLRSSTAEELLWDQIFAVPPTAVILYELDDPSSRFHPAQIRGWVERTFTIGTIGADSWRIGYLASPHGYSGALRDFKQALTICSANLSQWAALAAGAGS